MKAILGIIGLTAAVPALAQTPAIHAASDAGKYAGQTATVEGRVDNITTTRSGMVFIDIDGRYPDNAFAAVVFAADAGKLSAIKSLDGKTIDVTGPVSLYRGKPEIVVKSADQVKTK